VFFSKVSSLRLSNTFDFLFSILTSKEESVNTIESLTTEYGDSPGWIARLFLQKKKKDIIFKLSQQLQKVLAISHNQF